MTRHNALWLEAEADLAIPLQSGSGDEQFQSAYRDAQSSNANTTTTRSWIVTVDAIMRGIQWADLELTFSFPSDASQYSDYTTGVHRLSTFTPLTLEFREAVRQILGGGTLEGGAASFTYGSISSFTNLGFTEVSNGDGVLRYGFSSAHSVAWGYMPNQAAGERGDTFFNQAYMAQYATPVPGSYTWMTALHEVGHNMGLVHAHETLGMTGAPLIAPFDSVEYTVMTYRSYQNAPADYYRNESYGYPQTYMMLDIRALQQMYGADFTTNASDTTYSWSPTTGEMFINGVGQGAPGANRVFLTIWDGGGNDVYDFSNYTSRVMVDLSPGATSTTSSVQLAYLGDGNYARGNVFNALQYNNDPRSLIEVVIGTDFDDILVGNQANNILQGGDGNDFLIGGIGADELNGDNGFDGVSYQGSSTGVTVNLGDELTEVGGDAQGDTLGAIEKVLGSSHSDHLTGSDANDELFGEAGDDFLSGGAGDDLLLGGIGANMIDGGEGVDVAQFYGNRSDYSIRLIDGTVIVIGNQSKDVLTGVEILRFADGDVDPLLIVCNPGGSGGNAGSALVMPGLAEVNKAAGPPVLPPLDDLDPLVLPSAPGRSVAGDDLLVVCQPGTIQFDPAGFGLEPADLALQAGARQAFGLGAVAQDNDWII
ncbi:MAG: hypothetical protein J0L52_04980 [Caulobacterales bacterium]|nr:hypothetical protein [Caulobacterales bacterium]